MIQSLIYSRQASASFEILCEQLSELGIQTFPTQSLNLSRLLLNSCQVVHFLIDELPLTLPELLFLSVSKSLGRAIILSVYNSQCKHDSSFFSLFTPDALTVSQTNHLKFFRHWNCTKMILPELLTPQKRKAQSSQTQTKNQINLEFIYPMLNNLEEVFLFNSSQTIYFDGRLITKKHKQSPSQLRQKWNHWLKIGRIPRHFHLLLSSEKIEALIKDTDASDLAQLAVILANPQLSPRQFTAWLNQTINFNQLIILNEFQATGYSHTWTSGRNCRIISAQNWLKELHHIFEEPRIQPSPKSNLNPDLMFVPLINDLSRLYIQVFNQKTSLILDRSAKI